MDFRNIFYKLAKIFAQTCERIAPKSKNTDRKRE